MNDGAGESYDWRYHTAPEEPMAYTPTFRPVKPLPGDDETHGQGLGIMEPEVVPPYRANPLPPLPPEPTVPPLHDPIPVDRPKGAKKRKSRSPVSQTNRMGKRKDDMATTPSSPSSDPSPPSHDPSPDAPGREEGDGDEGRMDDGQRSVASDEALASSPLLPPTTIWPEVTESSTGMPPTSESPSSTPLFSRAVCVESLENQAAKLPKLKVRLSRIDASRSSPSGSESGGGGPYVPVAQNPTPTSHPHPQIPRRGTLHSQHSQLQEAVPGLPHKWRSQESTDELVVAWARNSYCCPHPACRWYCEEARYPSNPNREGPGRKPYHLEAILWHWYLTHMAPGYMVPFHCPRKHIHGGKTLCDFITADENQLREHLWHCEGSDDEKDFEVNRQKAYIERQIGPFFKPSENLPLPKDEEIEQENQEKDSYAETLSRTIAEVTNGGQYPINNEPPYRPPENLASYIPPAQFRKNGDEIQINKFTDNAAPSILEQTRKRHRSGPASKKIRPAPDDGPNPLEPQPIPTEDPDYDHDLSDEAHILPKKRGRGSRKRKFQKDSQTASVIPPPPPLPSTDTLDTDSNFGNHSFPEHTSTSMDHISPDVPDSDDLFPATPHKDVPAPSAEALFDSVAFTPAPSKKHDAPIEPVTDAPKSPIRIEPIPEPAIPPVEDIAPVAPVEPVEPPVEEDHTLIKLPKAKGKGKGRNRGKKKHTPVEEAVVEKLPDTTQVIDNAPQSPKEKEPIVPPELVYEDVSLPSESESTANLADLETEKTPQEEKKPHEPEVVGDLPEPIDEVQNTKRSRKALHPKKAGKGKRGKQGKSGDTLGTGALITEPEVTTVPAIEEAQNPTPTSMEADNRSMISDQDIFTADTASHPASDVIKEPAPIEPDLPPEAVDPISEGTNESQPEPPEVLELPVPTGRGRKKGRKKKAPARGKSKAAGPVEAEIAEISVPVEPEAEAEGNSDPKPQEEVSESLTEMQETEKPENSDEDLVITEIVLTKHPGKRRSGRRGPSIDTLQSSSTMAETDDAGSVTTETATSSSRSRSRRSQRRLRESSYTEPEPEPEELPTQPDPEELPTQPEPEQDKPEAESTANVENTEQTLENREETPTEPEPALQMSEATLADGPVEPVEATPPPLRKPPQRKGKKGKGKRKGGSVRKAQVANTIEQEILVPEPTEETADQVSEQPSDLIVEPLADAVDQSTTEPSAEAVTDSAIEPQVDPVPEEPVGITANNEEIEVPVPTSKRPVRGRKGTRVTRTRRNIQAATEPDPETVAEPEPEPEPLSQPINIPEVIQEPQDSAEVEPSIQAESILEENLKESTEGESLEVVPQRPAANRGRKRKGKGARKGFKAKVPKQTEEHLDIQTVTENEDYSALKYQSVNESLQSVLLGCKTILGSVMNKFTDTATKDELIAEGTKMLDTVLTCHRNIQDTIPELERLADKPPSEQIATGNDAEIAELRQKLADSEQRLNEASKQFEKDQAESDNKICSLSQQLEDMRVQLAVTTGIQTSVKSGFHPSTSAPSIPSLLSQLSTSDAAVVVQSVAGGKRRRGRSGGGSVPAEDVAQSSSSTPLPSIPEATPTLPALSSSGTLPLPTLSSSLFGPFADNLRTDDILGRFLQPKQMVGVFEESQLESAMSGLRNLVKMLASVHPIEQLPPNVLAQMKSSSGH